MTSVSRRRPRPDTGVTTARHGMYTDMYLGISHSRQGPEDRKNRLKALLAMQLISAREEAKKRLIDDARVNDNIRSWLRKSEARGDAMTASDGDARQWSSDSAKQLPSESVEPSCEPAVGEPSAAHSPPNAARTNAHFDKVQSGAGGKCAGTAPRVPRAYQLGKAITVCSDWQLADTD
jgi:hypothetical protein